LVELLTQFLDGGHAGAHLVSRLWKEGESVREEFTTRFPEDLIARVEEDRVTLTAMGIINTALVRLGGDGTDRLMAVLDDDGALVRFEAGPYPPNPRP